MSSAPGLSLRCHMVSVVVLRGTGKDARVLLVRRAGTYLHDVWSYVAGHVEAGESGWQTALRELREETGLLPATLHATSFCEQFYAAQDDGIELVPAFVARVADNVAVRLNGEHSAFRWATLDEACGLLPFGSQRDLLAHVRREFVEREPSPFLRIAFD
ncbi:NUDIX domain-containing protein [Rhodanobacter sp. B2A1Ga4]|uniref:NUDIX hydrolase n=1 Tax=Rhodanobacter sp. B2A1Ga4 TaxID=2778647 RepID=UPI001B38978F|nr:NUDIX domain-containing protein [Rhodanobacter sp. B2A1Ga4]MBQ4853189.1 NUDIX domain-containing protein [Rhodanobacter sp. B2A1Ga4]